MFVGYARVSTHEQHLDLQKDALTKAGCEKIYTDIASGVKSERIGLADCLGYLREGDTLVVWKLDRLGRSLKHLIDVVNELQKKNINFRSVQESIDTTTSSGKLFFHIFGAIAEFERDIIRERTQAGLTASRARGKIGGRPKKMSDKKIKMAKALMKDKNLKIKDICGQLEVSRATLYRYASPNILSGDSGFD